VEKHVIYGLCEPGKPCIRTVRYVGYTKHEPEKRLTSHLCEAQHENTCHRHRWLRKLKRQGLRPSIVVLEIIVSPLAWKAREKHWIAKLRKTNNLVNTTEGGEGLVGAPRSLYKRIGRKQRGKPGPMLGRKWPHPMSEESRRAISAGVLSSKKWRKGMKNRRSAQITPEGRLRLAVNKGKTFSAQHRARISAALSAMPEVLAKGALGSRWINRNGENRKLQLGQPKPRGWEYGRVTPRNEIGEFSKAA
jgi:hypothetical protein